MATYIRRSGYVSYDDPSRRIGAGLVNRVLDDGVDEALGGEGALLRPGSYTTAMIAAN